MNALTDLVQQAHRVQSRPYPSNLSAPIFTAQMELGRAAGEHLRVDVVSPSQTVVTDHLVEALRNIILAGVVIEVDLVDQLEARLIKESGGER